MTNIRIFVNVFWGFFYFSFWKCQKIWHKSSIFFIFLFLISENKRNLTNEACYYLVSCVIRRSTRLRGARIHQSRQSHTTHFLNRHPGQTPACPTRLAGDTVPAAESESESMGLSEPFLHCPTRYKIYLSSETAEVVLLAQTAEKHLLVFPNSKSLVAS